MPIEPDTVAQRIDFRADPERTWIVGNRFPINFYDVSTDEFNKTEQELLAHTEPVLKIIEQNSLKDMQEQEDISFLDHVKSSAGLATLRLNQTAVASGGLLGVTTGAQVDAFFKGTAVSSPVANPTNSNIILSTSSYLRRDALSDLAKVFSARQLQLRVILMHEYDYSSTLLWWADGPTGADVPNEPFTQGSQPRRPRCFSTVHSDECGICGSRKCRSPSLP